MMNLARSVRRTAIWYTAFLSCLTSLASGAEEDPNAALWAAAKSGDAQLVQELVERGADVNSEFRLGGTALLFAAQRGYVDVIEILLRNGADVSAREGLNNWGALMWATHGGYCEAVEVLLQHGADPNEKDFMVGQTPLWLAAAEGRLRCVEAMLASSLPTRPALDEAYAMAVRAGQQEIAAKIDALRSSTPTAAQWPQFRGKNASGVAEGATPPLHWNVENSENLKWKTAVPGLGHSSPIVWGDRLFLTTALREGGAAELHRGGPIDTSEDTGPQSWLVYCFDLATGERLWERLASHGLPAVKRHPKNSYASSTPATNGEVVVALFGSQGLYAYGMDGEPLWQQGLGTLDSGFFYDPDYQWGSASSPVIYRDLVIVQADLQENSFIAAYDVTDGHLRWRTARDEIPSWSTPTVYPKEGHPELVTNATNAIRGYDPLTGRELWSLNAGNSYVSAATPVAGLDLIYVANGYRPLKPIYAIRAGSSGDISLNGSSSSAAVAWSKKSGGPYYTTPLLYGEHLYILSTEGIFTSYYARTGEQVYRVRASHGDSFSASPVAANGKIYLMSESGNGYVVQAGIDYELLATNPLGEEVMATPALVGRKIIVRTRSHVLAVEAP